MACVEILCNECGYSNITNKIYSSCPVCGGTIRKFFDEDKCDDCYDRDYDRDYEEDYDEEDDNY